MPNAFHLAAEAGDRLKRIEGLLEEIADSLAEPTNTDAPVMRRRVPFNFTTNAAGDGEVYIAVPPGWTWNLLRYAVQLSAAATGYVAVYRGAENGQLLLAVSSAGPILTDVFAAEGDVITGNEQVLVVARALGAVTQVNGNLAVRATQDTKPADVH